MLHNDPTPDADLLVSLLTATMPFGKYKGKRLRDLPVSYLEWFARKGFPQGKAGRQLELMLEIKGNGLGDILTELERNLNRTNM